MYHITARSTELSEKIQHKINTKTKPLGSLGTLEIIAKQICEIQEALSPKLVKPTALIFAGDHGIAEEGVSPFPQEVTFQMVMNFLNKGAAINVFTKQNSIDLNVIDAGVNFDFPKSDELVDLKVRKGTRNALKENAISDVEYDLAVKNASDYISTLHKTGSNCVMFGEMGIANTSSAALIMHYITSVPINTCTGRGTGMDNEGLIKKASILSKVIDRNPILSEPDEIAKAVGGYEIIMIMASILRAAELKMLVLIDGFIVTSALLLAHKINPLVLEYCIFTHLSDENAHGLMLKHLHAKPLLKLGMRLGEGTGAAISFPLIQSAVNFINEMSSFEQAEVSNKE